MGYVLLALIAFCPGIFYMFYIIAFDHRKPEPPRALVISALLGIVVAMSVVLSLEASVVRIEEGLSFTQSLIVGFFKLALPSEVAK